MTVLGLLLAVVLELERGWLFSWEFSLSMACSSRSPEYSWKSSNSTSLASPRAAWVRGSTSANTAFCVKEHCLPQPFAHLKFLSRWQLPSRIDLHKNLGCKGFLEVICSNSQVKAGVTSKLKLVTVGLVPLSFESLQGLTFYCDPENLFNYTNHRDLILMSMQSIFCCKL